MIQQSPRKLLLVVVLLLGSQAAAEEQTAHPEAALTALLSENKELLDCVSSNLKPGGMVIQVPQGATSAEFREKLRELDKEGKCSAQITVHDDYSELNGSECE